MLLNKQIYLIFAILISISLPIIPELAVILLCTLGIIFCLQKQSVNSYSKVLLFIFFVFKILDSLTMPQNALRNIGEFFVGFFIYFGLDYFKSMFTKVASFIVSSLVLSVLLAFSQVWFVSKTLTYDWMLNWQGEMAKMEIFLGYKKYIPTNIQSSYIWQSLDYQGSGEVEFEMELRSDKVFEINLALLHPSLAKGRSDKRCLVEKEWSKCVIRVDLKYQQQTVLALGGFNTWIAPIDIRNEKLNVIIAPKTAERLSLLPRISGFTFNSNAFGALIAIVCCLCAIISKRVWWNIFSTLFSLIGIILSGSRGALIAVLVGYFTLIVAKSRYFRLLTLFLSIILILFVLFQVNTFDKAVEPNNIIKSQPEMRSFDILDHDAVRGRLELWRLAAKSWLENPRTFLIGVGDLTETMKIKFDARSSGYGLTKEGITHAHNLWFQVAGESGFLGLVSMLCLWGWVILRAWRSRDSGALTLLVVIFVINSVDYLFYYAPVHLCFWLAAHGFVPNKESNAVDVDKVFQTQAKEYV